MKIVVLLVLYIFVNQQGKPGLSQKEYVLPPGATAEDCEKYAVPYALNDIFSKERIAAFDHKCVSMELEPLKNA